MNKYLLKIMVGVLVISCLVSWILIDLERVCKVDNQSLRGVSRKEIIRATLIRRILEIRRF